MKLLTLRVKFVGWVSFLISGFFSVFFCFFFGFLAGPPIRSVRLTAVPGLRSAHQVFRVDKVTSQLIAVQF